MMHRRTIELLLLALLLAACSTGGDDALAYPAEHMSDNTTYYGITPTETSGYFKGVWSINGTQVDTMFVGYSYQNYSSEMLFAFYDLPCEAIAKQLYPDVNITKITKEASIGGPLRDEELLWFKTLVDHGDNNCLERGLSQPIKPVGYSKGIIYYEIPAVDGAAYRYFPFVVTPADGQYFALVLDIIPGKSVVNIDTQGQSVSCILRVKQVEEIRNGSEPVIHAQSPDMELIFTSIQKVANPWSGN